MVLSTVTGSTNPVTIKDIPKVEEKVSEQALVKKPGNKEIEKNMSTEEYVREYFKDIPIMIQVARCESTFRHLDKDGKIHRGVVNNDDVGVMQINEYYHLDKSIRGNYDIYTLEGNTAYARDLYEREGTKPWSSSKPCWGKYQNTQTLETKDIALNK